MRKLGLLAISTVLVAAPVIGVVPSADAAILGKSAILGHSAGSVVAKWKNCTVVNRRLPHGVGRATAHDATSGTPVTSFRHDTAMYKAAMRANQSLDRDKDGIACEKR
jgi:hypothetical protein